MSHSSPLPTLALSAALLLAGCSRQPETIKVGEFTSMTGKEATFGQTLHKGISLAVEEANASGGLLGRKLELVTEDNQSKAGESATIVKKFVSRDKVVAILGDLTSGRTLEAAPVAQNAKIPLITPGATAPEVTSKGDYIFRSCFMDTFQGAVMAKFSRESLKLKRVAILSSVSSPQSVALAKVFRQRFSDAGGTIALEQKFTDGDKDFRAQLTSIKAANPDGIYVPCYYTEAALICKQARDLAIDVPLFGIDGWESSEFLSIGGKAVEGGFFSTHYSAESKDPTVVAFNQRFKQRWGIPSDAISALGYDSVMMLVDAIKRAGSTEPAKLQAALASTKNFHGVTGIITLDAQRNATKSAVVLTVKDGKFQFVETVAP